MSCAEIAHSDVNPAAPDITWQHRKPLQVAVRIVIQAGGDSKAHALKRQGTLKPYSAGTLV